MSIDLTDQWFPSNQGYGRNLKSLQGEAQELAFSGQWRRDRAGISVLFMDI